MWLGVGVTVAGLFRYDNGVFTGGAAAVGLIVVHARDRRLLMRRLGLLVATACGVAAPCLLWIHWHSGLADAVDQMWTYAMREGARTRIESRPAFAIGDLLVIDPPQSAGAIQITWSPAVGLAARRTLAERYQLHDEAPDGPPESRTWSYSVADPSSVRRLTVDPFVEHTRDIRITAQSDAAGKSAASARSARRPQRVRVPLLLPDVASRRGGGDHRVPAAIDR